MTTTDAPLANRAVAGFLHRLAALGAGRCELVESEDRLDEWWPGAGGPKGPEPFRSEPAPTLPAGLLLLRRTTWSRLRNWSPAPVPSFRPGHR